MLVMHESLTSRTALPLLFIMGCSFKQAITTKHAEVGSYASPVRKRVNFVLLTLLYPGSYGEIRSEAPRVVLCGIPCCSSRHSCFQGLSWKGDFHDKWVGKEGDRTFPSPLVVRNPSFKSVVSSYGTFSFGFVRPHHFRTNFPEIIHENCGYLLFPIDAC